MVQWNLKGYVGGSILMRTDVGKASMKASRFLVVPRLSSDWMGFE
jgi:hypothetical protein